MEILKRKRGRPSLTPEQKLEKQKQKIASLGEKKTRAKRGSKKKDERTEKVVVTNTTKFLLTPAGKCPVPLFGSDSEAIRVWAQQFHNTTMCGALHTKQSLTYWLRDFFDLFSEDYKIAKRNLSDICHILEIKDYDPILRRTYENIIHDEINKDDQECNIDEYSL